MVMMSCLATEGLERQNQQLEGPTGMSCRRGLALGWVEKEGLAGRPAGRGIVVLVHPPFWSPSGLVLVGRGVVLVPVEAELFC